MYIVKIIPIANGLPDKYFSYFSKDKYEVGSLVKINIKNRNIFGIIKESTLVKNEKMSIKGEKFILKKIDSILNKNFLNKKLIYILENISYLYGLSESEILKDFLPGYIFDNYLNFDLSIKDINISPNNTKRNINKVKINNFDDRMLFYKNEIKKSFNTNNSIVIFFPTINDLKNAKQKLIKDFDTNILSFHSKENIKEIKKNIESLNIKNNFLILSTTSILPFLLKDKINLNTIIIEKENSYNYFSHSIKRQIDGRKIIEYFANNLDINIIKSGNLISFDTYKSINNSKKKNLFIKNDKLNIKIIDRTKENINFNINKKYNKAYFDNTLISKLEEFKEKKKGLIFFYTKRKGLFSETICADCQQILKCDICEKPLVLFEKEGKRVYICTKCKSKIELKKEENLTCKSCNSWRMQTIGIGSEGIAQNLKENGWNTHIIDSENTKSQKKIDEEIKAWQNEKLSILIGTDLALSYINKDIKIDFCGIISMDSLFSIPEINIDEKIYNIVLEINEKVKTKDKIIIQTRIPESGIWKYIKENDKEKFLNEEMENRKNFNLPPYSNIIKFKIYKKDFKIKDDIERLINKICNEEKVSISKISFGKEMYTGNINAMFIVRKDFWEIENENIIIPTNFAKKIHSLLTDFKIEINPQSVY